MVDRGLVVALLGDAGIARELGKKSGETDLALHQLREGGRPTSTLVPVRFPERVQPLAYASLMSDAALLSVVVVDRYLGEAILAADAAAIDRGILILQNFVPEDQVRGLLRGTSLERMATVADQGSAVRTALEGLEPREVEAPGRVVVDQAFAVKGVGTVVLGFVQGGPIDVHANLRVYPGRKRAEVRSVQVQDVDVPSAGPGEHVGLALKNVEVQDLVRGQILAPEDSLEVVEANEVLHLEVSCGRFYKGSVVPGATLHLAVGMQVVPVRIRAAQVVPGARGDADVVPQGALVLPPGGRGMLLDLDTKGPRIVGGATARP